MPASTGTRQQVGSIPLSGRSCVEASWGRRVPAVLEVASLRWFARLLGVPGRANGCPCLLAWGSGPGMEVVMRLRTSGGMSRDRMVAATAALLHDAWRAPRALPGGGFEPRLKPDGAGGEVDIANANFADLPAMWQEENLAAAAFAVDFLLRHPGVGVEAMSALVHQDWLSRNARQAEPAQLVAYEELSEDEKEKDRRVARAAQEALDLELRGRGVAP